jgi:hypothetical protein
MHLDYKPTLIVIAAILTYQLMIPPVIGLADQGDYARLAGVFHLSPTVKKPEERFYAYLNRTYAYMNDPTFRIPEWESFSTQYVFVVSAILLNKWISKDGLFDIRVLALIEILAFLVACYLLLGATRRLLPGRLHYLVSLALIVVFCDAGYICYFNSFYYEPASYIFLLALVALWLDLIANRRFQAKYMATFGLCALLFVAAKPQNSPVGVIFGIYVWRFRRFVQPRWLAPLVSVATLASSLAVYESMPKINKAATAFDMLFLQVLPQSSDPAAELRSLGLDPSYVKYIGLSAYAPSVPFWGNAAFRDEFHKRVNHFTIAGFYLRHPGKFLDYISWVLPQSTSLRPEWGNFEKSAGYPGESRSRAFSLWSRFHGHYLAPWSSGVLIALMLSVPASIWIAFASRELQRRLLAECFAVLALSAVTVFFATVLGDSADIVKHLHLYNLLTDICLVFAAISGCVCIASLGRSSTHRVSNRRAPMVAKPFVEA